ncbi:class I SAM-dependent methyltransferase [Pseudomonas kairouanensis]|uniref:Class I SAM-dependent methyltransferase n=1 Tax=Pseudomonas kairouanensis TaxID=2293832 RepID=A0A4Z0AW34_9PSED|nr:class I SAM-dependent methyltransferase [Pseudomonas kairouanensis]TFY90128.1 class I SAM-dependent methyltransferase [Pseudomonas kairouanensis]
MSNQRHNYEYEVDSRSTTAPAHVVRLVGQCKRVLEVGCGPGSITRILATEGQCSVTGLELDTEAIKKASPFCEHIYQADLNAEHWPLLLEGSAPFDVLVAADVLEHLYDPWTALKRMVPLIKDDGYLVISLPHAGHAAVLACLLNGNFEYRDWGLLDRTHIRFFGLKNMEDLFSQADLKVIEVAYVRKQPEETEFAGQWSQLPTPTQQCLRQSPQATVYQVVVKAVPNHSAGEALRLNVRADASNRLRIIHPLFFSSVRQRVGPYLPARFKKVLRTTLKKLGLNIG